MGANPVTGEPVLGVVRWATKSKTALPKKASARQEAESSWESVSLF